MTSNGGRREAVEAGATRTGYPLRRRNDAALADGLILTHAARRRVVPSGVPQHRLAQGAAMVCADARRRRHGYQRLHVANWAFGNGSVEL